MRVLQSQRSVTGSAQIAMCKSYRVSYFVSRRWHLLISNISIQQTSIVTSEDKYTYTSVFVIRWMTVRFYDVIKTNCVDIHKNSALLARANLKSKCWKALEWKKKLFKGNISNYLRTNCSCALSFNVNR